MTRLFLLGMSAPLLAACATSNAESPYPGGNSADQFVCRNTMLEQFKGRPADPQLANEVIRASGSKTIQWVPSGTMVTMEYRADRVRVWLDQQNRVERVNCG